MTTPPTPRDIPQAGKGRAYAIASALLGKPEMLSGRPWLGVALTHFERAIRQHATENAFCPPADLWARLNGQFDLDSIVTFSHAWHIWEDLSGIQRNVPAWDQELFFGTSAYSPSYHDGIRTLANRQLSFVIPACRAYFKGQFGRALDVGAGLGVQMTALRAEGIISSAICIDTPFVSSLGQVEAPEHTWIGDDLRHFDAEKIPTVDLIWVGNVLHHYEEIENVGILKRFASKLSPTGVIVIQDYVVGSQGVLGLAAAALGVHFALTTNRGRDYSENGITAIVEEAFWGHSFDHRVDGQFSSLLFYRKG